MKELTFEVDNFGRPLLHSKRNSVIMQMYSIIVNSEDQAYPNHTIGLGLDAFRYAAATDENMADLSDKLSTIISDVLPGITISSVIISKTPDNSINNNIKISISFTYFDEESLVDDYVEYVFLDKNGNTTTHIFA